MAVRWAEAPLPAQIVRIDTTTSPTANEGHVRFPRRVQFLPGGQTRFERYQAAKLSALDRTRLAEEYCARSGRMEVRVIRPGCSRWWLEPPRPFDLLADSEHLAVQGCHPLWVLPPALNAGELREAGIEKPRTSYNDEEREVPLDTFPARQGAEDGYSEFDIDQEIEAAGGSLNLRVNSNTRRRERQRRVKNPMVFRVARRPPSNSDFSTSVCWPLWRVPLLEEVEPVRLPFFLSRGAEMDAQVSQLLSGWWVVQFVGGHDGPVLRPGWPVLLQIEPLFTVGTGYFHLVLRCSRGLTDVLVRVDSASNGFVLEARLAWQSGWGEGEVEWRLWALVRVLRVVKLRPDGHLVIASEQSTAVASRCEEPELILDEELDSAAQGPSVKAAALRVAKQFKRHLDLPLATKLQGVHGPFYGPVRRTMRSPWSEEP